MIEWKRADRYSSLRVSVPTEVAERLKALERENHDLRQIHECYSARKFGSDSLSMTFRHAAATRRARSRSRLSGIERRTAARKAFPQLSSRCQRSATCIAFGRARETARP